MSSLEAIRRWLWLQLPGHGLAYLAVFVNTKCEQDCVHCFVRAEADDKLLTPDAFAAIGRNLPHLMQLTITGGEPTLRRDLPDVVAALANTSGVPFLSMHTNGFVPQRIERQVREILDRVRSAQFSVRLSLDGFGELHDAIRRRPGSWERAVETLERLASVRREERRLRVFVDTVLSQRNNEHLEPLIRFLDERQNQMDGRELLYLRGDPRDPQSGEVDANAYRSALGRFAPDLTRGGRGEVGFSLPESARREVYRQILAIATGHGQADGCVAGLRFAVLGAKGEVSACEMPAGGGILGNVTVDGPDIQAILGGTRGSEARKNIREGRCAKGCSYECAALATVALRANRLARAVIDTSPPGKASTS